MVGRPISAAADPRAAAETFVRHIEEALAKRAQRSELGIRRCSVREEEVMPKGYVIGRATVTNPTAWAAYAAKASEAMKVYGGNPIVRGGKSETVEGNGVARNVVIEFASYEAGARLRTLA